MTAVPEAPPSRTVTVGGRRIAYREAGDASSPALVLLHGLGGNAAMWRRQYGALSDRFRVLGWDMPGYGGSDPLAGTPAAADFARALAGLLDALGIDRVCPVGQSVAALIAAGFARAFPDRIRAVVLAHPLFGFGALAPAARAAAVEERTGAFLRLGPRGFAEDRGPRLLAPGASEGLVAEVVATMAGARPEGYVPAVAMMADIDLSAEAAQAAAPVHIVAGSDDPLAPPDRCHALAERLPGATCKVIQGAGHYAALERPEAFNSALLAAFERRERS
ncbi:MAG: alpha/beta fold hydrolase [Defluviicoccus sp.]|nr:alpha/beta fold hydrolase [Defluviicoccus sp.]MDE0275919.1 alpha/beta fold hydrolase [Defluviicoccus sp.]